MIAYFRGFTVPALAFLAFAPTYAGDAAPPAPTGGGTLARPIPEDAFYTYTTNFGVHFGAVRFGMAAPANVRLDRVELYTTRDMGQTWTRYGEDPRAQSPFPVTVDGEGVYGFYTVGTDARGRREIEPRPGFRPETVVVVDRTPPMAQWIAPTGPTLTNAEEITFEWESSDAHYGPNPVSIEVSGDYGRTWSVVGAELGAEKHAAGLPAKGKYTWTPNARLGSPLRFMLVCRDRAGNTLRLRCPTEVLIDNIPPTVRITGPSVATSMAVPVDVDAADEGGSGLMEVVLYATYDGGRSWFKSAAESRAGQPILLSARQPGKIGLMAVARDGRGNHSPLPYEGMTPPHELYIDVEKPVVTLSETFISGVGTVASGATPQLQWTATDDLGLELNSAEVWYSEDNGQEWKKDSKTPMSSSPGLYTMLFPTVKENVRDYRVKVTVRDRAGNVGEAVSRPFTLEAAQTAIVNVGPSTSSIPPVAVTPLPSSLPPIMGGETGLRGEFSIQRPTTPSITETDLGGSPIPPPLTYGRELDPLPVTPTPLPDVSIPPVDNGGFTPSIPAVPPMPGVPTPTVDRMRQLEEMATDPSRAAEALAEVDGRIARGENTYDLHLIRGWAYLTMRHLPNYVTLAAEAAATAWKMDETNPRSRYLNGEILLVSGQNYYGDIEMDHDWTLSAQQYNEWAANRDALLQRAYEFVNGLVADYPTNKQYLGLLGDIRTYQGRAKQQDVVRRGVLAFDPATRAAVQASLSTANPDPRYNRLEDEAAAAARTLYQDAARILEQACAQPPVNDYNNLLMLGELYYRPDGLFDPTTGRRYLSDALRATDIPGNTYREAYYGLAMCNLFLRDYPNARANFERARDRFEPDNRIQQNIADSLARIAAEGF